MIDEVFMVSSDLWTDIDARLSEIFSASIELTFAGVLEVVIGNYLQSPPLFYLFIYLFTLYFKLTYTVKNITVKIK